MAINWGLLRSSGPVDIAGNFARGFEMGRKIIDDAHQRSALAAYAAHPGDPAARAMLYQVNPALGARLEARDEDRSDFNRKADARSALAGWMTGPTGIPEPVGLTGTTSALGTVASGPEIDSSVARADATNPLPSMGPAIDSSVAAPAVASEDAPIVVTGKRTEPAPASENGLLRQPEMSDSWKQYVQADPQGAMKTLIDRADLGKEQALALAGQMDFIGRLAVGVTDQASYDQAKAVAQSKGYDTSHLPAEFSPQVAADMQAQSMSAKDYLKQKWDITDDQIDNAETERHHTAEEGNTRRGQDLTDSRGRRGQDLSADTSRRGQDLSAETTRRGQDLSSTDRKRGQDMRRKKTASGDRPTIIVNPKTGQRMKLVNGAWVPA